MKKLLTIFTPTYNRAYILPELYRSLCNQTSNSFKWVVVDDGSTDGTEKIVRCWIEEKKIEIIYFKQENQGKAVAHNKGVELADTRLFTCVDSDDRLTPQAVEIIGNSWNEAEARRCIGILCYKGRIAGGEMTVCKEKVETSTLREAYRKHGLSGDTMLIYRTDIVSKYKFPHFEGEKFVPESYLYDLIDQNGELYFLHKVLYLADYLEDGYTQNMRKIIKNNPQGYLAYIIHRMKLDESIKEKCIDTIKFIAVSKCLEIKRRDIINKSEYPMITFIVYPLGFLFYYRCYKSVEV